MRQFILNTLALLIILLNVCSFAQQEYRLIKVEKQIWMVVLYGGYWEYQYEHHYGYNAMGNLNEKIWIRFHTDTISRDYYEYFENDSLEIELYQRWHGQWITESKYTYEYDSEDKLIEKDTYHWRYGQNGEHYRRDMYEYDDGTNLSSLSYQLNMELQASIRLAERWQERIRYEYFYNEYNLLKKEYEYNINYLTYNMDLARSGQHFYDENQRLILSTYIGYEMDHRYQYLYAYNNDGQLVERIFQEWNEEELIWEDKRRNVYVYNGSGYLMYDILQTMTWVGWSNSYRDVYFYEPISGVEQQSELIENFTLYQNYPNPFNPTTKIRYTIPTPPSSSPLPKGRTEEGFVTLKVYDILGNEIATLVNEEKPAGTYQVEFDGSNLASGIYIYTLRGNEYTSSRKMLFLK